jgi:small GTP-binding protein
MEISSELEIEFENDKIDLSSIKDSFNLLIIGDSLVGKTSILERYCHDFFKREKTFQNFLQIYKKKYSYKNKKYLIKFWEPPKFINCCNNIEINMLNNCDGILYVCSYDDPASLTHINSWYQFLTQYIDLSTKEMALIINKKDLKEQEKLIKEGQIEKKSKDLQLQYFEISAKTGENLFNTIKLIINKIIDKYINDNKNNDYEDNNESDNDNEFENEGGCFII